MSCPRILTNLGVLREDRRWSIRQAADELGINRGTLSKMERGLELPTDDVYERIRVVFPEGPRWWTEMGDRAP